MRNLRPEVSVSHEAMIEGKLLSDGGLPERLRPASRFANQPLMLFEADAAAVRVSVHEDGRLVGYELEVVEAEDASDPALLAAAVGRAGARLAGRLGPET